MVIMLSLVRGILDVLDRFASLFIIKNRPYLCLRLAGSHNRFHCKATPLWGRCRGFCSVQGCEDPGRRFRSYVITIPMPCRHV
jgi:hypothetical protein